MMALIMVLTMSGTVLSCLDGFSYATGENTVQEQDPDNGADGDADADTDTDIDADTDAETGSGRDDNSGADDASAEEEKNNGPEATRGGKMTAKGGAVLVSGTWPKNDSTDDPANTWTIDEEGVMTLSGSGAMPDYDDVKNTPWAAYRRDETPYIKKLVVEPGITKLAKNMLARPNHLEEVDASGCGTLSGAQGDSLFKASAAPKGESAITSKLTKVDFSGNPDLTYLGDQTFRECYYIEYLNVSDTIVNSSMFKDNGTKLFFLHARIR